MNAVTCLFHRIRRGLAETRKLCFKLIYSLADGVSDGVFEHAERCFNAAPQFRKHALNLRKFRGCLICEIAHCSFGLRKPCLHGLKFRLLITETRCDVLPFGAHTRRFGSLCKLLLKHCRLVVCVSQRFGELVGLSYKVVQFLRRLREFLLRNFARCRLLEFCIIVSLCLDDFRVDFLKSPG